MSYEILVGGGEDLVPDGDVVDESVRVKRENVIGNPGLSGGELGEGRNVAISDRDCESDASSGEGTENIRVGVKDLDAVDGGVGFEEGGDLGGRREIVGDGAVVDTDRVGGGGEAEEEREKKEREK